MRLWAPSTRDENSWSVRWAELARPQIHGHDVNDVMMLANHEHVLLSGSEEKTIRVFGATQAFVESLTNVSGALTAPGFND